MGGGGGGGGIGVANHFGSEKNGSTRFCVNYQKLNDVTRKDAYQLPRIDTTLSTLNRAKWFSTLDLLSGYWQVEVAEAD